ncbi:histone H3.v1 isoform X5 [Fundulus heteroclitus]|uniref:histone H3.v1 isoform X5 n=1 Tax=Fundulus heteroclitus TaxID=8078 RepID=UPI00165A9A5C|nr:histone H3.v1 isoform X5 [Fundulus heteroclitus]
MFYCSSGGSDPLNMSKSGVLRGIITEKLSTAAREILAVVERTVADYEEEASGFRREIERQRRQLELLQPRLKLPRTELLPDLQSHEEVVVGEEQEEQQLTQSTGVEAAESHSPPGKHSEEEEEDDVKGEGEIEEEGGHDEEVKQEEDDDDEQEDEESVIKNKMIHEDLKDPDFEIPPRKKRLRPRKRKNIWSLMLQLLTLGSWTMKLGSPQALFKVYRVLEKVTCPSSQNPNRTTYKMRMKKVTATLTPAVPEIRHQRETRP